MKLIRAVVPSVTVLCPSEERGGVVARSEGNNTFSPVHHRKLHRVRQQQYGIRSLSALHGTAITWLFRSCESCRERFRSRGDRELSAPLATFRLIHKKKTSWGWKKKKANSCYFNNHKTQLPIVRVHSSATARPAQVPRSVSLINLPWVDLAEQFACCWGGRLGARLHQTMHIM